MKLLVATAMCADPVFEGAFVESGALEWPGGACGRAWSGLGANLSVSGVAWGCFWASLEASKC